MSDPAQPMRIEVRLFAILRERAGLFATTLDLPPGATVADAASALAQRHPPLCDLLPRIAFAVNREYAPATTTLHNGDELALIPPVSGG